MILPSASPLGWLLALATAVAYVLPAALAPRADAAGRLAMAPAWVLHAAALAWGWAWRCSRDDWAVNAAK